MNTTATPSAVPIAGRFRPAVTLADRVVSFATDRIRPLAGLLLRGVSGEYGDEEISGLFTEEYPESCEFAAVLSLVPSGGELCLEVRIPDADLVFADALPYELYWRFWLSKEDAILLARSVLDAEAEAIRLAEEAETERKAAEAKRKAAAEAEAERKAAADAQAVEAAKKMLEENFS